MNENQHFQHVGLHCLLFHFDIYRFKEKKLFPSDLISHFPYLSWTILYRQFIYNFYFFGQNLLAIFFLRGFPSFFKWIYMSSLYFHIHLRQDPEEEYESYAPFFHEVCCKYCELYFKLCDTDKAWLCNPSCRLKVNTWVGARAGWGQGEERKLSKGLSVGNARTKQTLPSDKQQQNLTYSHANTHPLMEASGVWVWAPQPGPQGKLLEGRRGQQGGERLAAQPTILHSDALGDGHGRNYFCLCLDLPMWCVYKIHTEPA